jgi:alcohol dehydrogenase YqhD (iron-dependent ADH family)
LEGTKTLLNFEFYAPTKLIYGLNTQKQIGQALTPYSPKKVLVHYGGGSIKSNGIYDDVVNSLKEHGIEYVELGGVVPNPRLSLVYEGIDLVRRQSVDFILAVGGGSVIDSAKAIAAGAPYEGDVWDFYEKGVSPVRALPVATILTLPAAGSEMSTRSVITNEGKQLKLRLATPLIRPILSIINPALFTTLPKAQIANGITDIMSHIFERYFTDTVNTALTDALCEATLRTVMENGLKLMENPGDYDAWAEIGFAGTIAHNDILGVGRNQDWASHNIEHEISAIYDIAHGEGLAIIIPAWMTYTCRDNIQMFLQFALNVMGVTFNSRAPLHTIKEGIDKLCDFYRRLGQPLKLKEIGIGDENFELMARKATNDDEIPLGGFKKLYSSDIEKILKLALE